VKYCVLIIDGSAGHPLPQFGGRTCLELARTPNLDIMAKAGTVGLARTVPDGMEPSSALACMSILGYDPRVYYRGRSAIEALSMGIRIEEGEAVFRCNLVALRGGKMWDYSAGHISTEEASQLVTSLEKGIGDANIHFYPGVGYRHILKLKGKQETLKAVCTPPHDIPGRKIEEYLPKGSGSEILRDLMRRSEAVLADHPVNLRRISRGEIPATSIWLFWPSGQVPDLPSFMQRHGLKAGMISGVDLLRGLAQMAKMDNVRVAGVTDGLDNDYGAQGESTIKILQYLDLAVVHVEAPDEAGHSGSIERKIEAIERTDEEIVGRLRTYEADQLRTLILPDHPTPIDVQTHTPEPVPFLLSGPGFVSNGAKRLTEAEALASGFFIEAGYDIINKLIKL
jgi:2,3-bisphosphoglycerate-independent phosphoglycerate mutase